VIGPIGPKRVPPGVPISRRRFNPSARLDRPWTCALSGHNRRFSYIAWCALAAKESFPRVSGSGALRLYFGLLSCSFVDSLMLVNEMPLIFWCLLCVNLSGSVYSRLTGPPKGRWLLRRIGFPLLAGATFAIAYQVKVSAIPILGFLVDDRVSPPGRPAGWPERKHWAALALASLSTCCQSLGVQLFYQRRPAFPWHMIGEVRLYAMLIPESLLFRPTPAA